MGKKRRPKWATKVARAMEKACPLNCSHKYKGVIRDAKTGEIEHIYDCKNACRIRRK